MSLTSQLTTRRIWPEKEQPCPVDKVIDKWVKWRYSGTKP